MQDAHASYIKVGKIGSTYGIQGWLKIHSYTEMGPAILDYRPWHLLDGDGSTTQIELEEGKIHGKGIIVKFAGINNPETARLLTGKIILIQRSQLPPLKKDEYYWSDLIGLTVINSNGETLGTVSYLIETGSNDVLVVKGDKEHAIPFLEGDVIKKIDLQKKEILVDWELI